MRYIYWIILVLLVISIFLVSCQPESTTDGQTTNNSSSSLDPIGQYDEYISVEEVSTQESIDAVLRQGYQPDRDTYGEGTWKGKKFIIKDVFKNLSALPDDFYKVEFLLGTERMQPEMLCELEPKYYEQPEFLPEQFMNVLLNIYKEPDPTHWTPEGYGTFPSDFETITVPGTTLQGCAFFHSGPGVEGYQGFGLKPVYPLITEYNGKKVNFTDPGITKQYLKFEVSPQDVLLYPTYFMFQKGWINKVKLNLVISPDTPPGKYAVGFDITRPTIENSANWSRKYGIRYFNPGFVRIGREQFWWVVTVEEP